MSNDGDSDEWREEMDKAIGVVVQKYQVSQEQGLLYFCSLITPSFVKSRLEIDHIRKIMDMMLDKIIEGRSEKKE